MLPIFDKLKKLLSIIVGIIYRISGGRIARSIYSYLLISLDRMEDDGRRRQIMSESVDFKVDGVKYSFTIKVYDYNKYKDWLLIVSSFSPIPNIELLIKLGNGEVIILPAIDIKVGAYNVVGVDGYYKIANYYSLAYEMDLSNFQKINDYGIVKVRIPTPLSYREKSFYNNSLGSHIACCKEFIDDRLTTRHKSI